MKTSGWASGVSDPSAVKIFKHNVSPFTFTMTRRQFMLQKINNKQGIFADRKSDVREFNDCNKNGMFYEYLLL